MQKSPENLENTKTSQNNLQNSKNMTLRKNGIYVEK